MLHWRHHMLGASLKQNSVFFLSISLCFIERTEATCRIVRRFDQVIGGDALSHLCSGAQGTDAHWLGVAEQRRQAEHSVRVERNKAIWREGSHYPHLIHKRQLRPRWLCLNVTWFKSRKHRRQRQHKKSGHIRTCCNFFSLHITTQEERVWL